VTEVAPFNRTLDQELLALLRGVSLECPVCGEFVLHRRAEICCPECGLRIARELEPAKTGVQLGAQAG
jgi:predicted RNA-binding Zn-ribbon protein involved in translation (DUF1610 family)